MRLYDGRSPIDWFYGREMTPGEMKGDESLSALFEQQCVLFDDGVGKVYSFATLDSLADRYGVSREGSAEAVFDAIIEASGSHAEATLSTEDRLSDLEAAVCELYESTL